jgi:D-amino-acid dehydrogenase
MAARRLGVTFRFGVTIDRLEADGGRITACAPTGPLTGRRLCAGAGQYSPQLVAPLGIRCRSIRSRAIRSPCRSPTPARPVSTVMDETHKVAITRLGDRIRVGGTAELAGFDLRLRPRAGARWTHS